MSNFYMVLFKIYRVLVIPPLIYYKYIVERGDWTDGNANSKC